MNIINAIIIVALLLLIFYAIKQIFFKSNIIMDKDIDANAPYEVNKNDEKIIKSGDIGFGNKSNFMLSVWFAVRQWNTDGYKNILYLAKNSAAVNYGTITPNSALKVDTNTEFAYSEVIPNITSGKNIAIGMEKNENNLIIDLQVIVNSDTKLARYKLKNIPIQKWNCLTLSVDGKTLDVYLDGKLRNSFILPGLYKNMTLGQAAEKRNMYLGNMNGKSPSLTAGSPSLYIRGFVGNITRVRYEPDSIDPQTAYNIYREGIKTNVAKNMLEKYNLEFKLTEFGEEDPLLELQI